MAQSITFILSLVGLWLLYRLYKSRVNKAAQNKAFMDKPFPKQWAKILEAKVPFYRQLPEKDKRQFEKEVKWFIVTTDITGTPEVKVSITDRLLVASSAVIPVFGFPGWEYNTLNEVILYPGPFHLDMGMQGVSDKALGMVGTGMLDGKMLLSKPHLHKGFDNTTDKKNVGIHEFIHLIDKEDGDIDGLPKVLIEESYALPWLNLMYNKMEEIKAGTSDIDPYGATNKVEFLTVAGEYFFERPHLLQKKHPKLYKMLEQFFNQPMIQRIQHANGPKGKEIGRNDPCFCGSGEKYKLCCGV